MGGILLHTIKMSTTLDIHNEPEPDTDVSHLLSQPLPTEPVPARAQAMSLDSLSRSIDTDISRHVATLTTNGVDMDTPLVDRQGFPLQNVDLVAIRTARQRIRVLRNDGKALRERITLLLHLAMNGDAATPTQNGTKDSPRVQPFARVNSVADNSPAHSAGLQADDQLLTFGGITASTCGENLRALASPGVVVDGQPIPVTLKRDVATISATLIPRTGWGGRGMLG